MSKKAITFGEFLRKKRQNSEFTMRKFADEVGISPVHMSYIETNQRAAPKDDKLKIMVKLLRLNKEDEERFFDLAAESAKSPRITGDLPDYILGNPLVTVALRTAQDTEATDTEWIEFIEKLRNRQDKEAGGEKDGT